MIFSVSCTEKETEKPNDVLSVKEVVNNSSIYVDKEISTKGAVDHVCEHGGKRLFIIGENPEDRFKITAGSDVGSFTIELEGSDILVKGVVVERKINEAFSDNREAEITAESKPEVAHEGYGDGDEEAQNKDEEIAETMKKIIDLRAKLKDSDGDYLSFYSIDCNSFDEIK